jgi:predicted nucleic acid-binding protein
VYVETNFVLELALLQEQHSACEELLTLCEEGCIGIVLPALSYVEPFGTLFRRRAERNVIKQSLDQTLRELGRTASLAQPVEDARTNLERLLVTSSEEEIQRWKSTRSRIAAAAELIPFDAGVLASAIAVEDRYDLSTPDAVIYASVRDHLDRVRPPQSCFLNRNTADFDDPDMVSELSAFGCKMLPHFDRGLAYVQAILRRDDHG